MFNLANYEKEIRDMAQANNVVPVKALEMFVLNLTVMKPHYSKGTGDVNFRAEGQKWNELTSVERNTQRTAMLDVLTKTSRARPATRD